MEFRGLRVVITCSSLEEDNPDISCRIGYPRDAAERKEAGITVDSMMAFRARESLPHPHVSHGRLCYGEGSQLVTNARKSWDIITLYTIVLNILHTYNRHGAYVWLERYTTEAGLRCNVMSCQKWIQ